MTNTIIARAFVALVLMVTATSSFADRASDLAAIVEGNKQTQALLKKQDMEGALRNAEATYTLSLDTLGQDNPNTANLATIYAQLVGATGDYQKALKLYKQAVSTLELRYGEDDLRLVAPLVEMGAHADLKKKLSYAERALAIQRAQAPEDKLEYAYTARTAGEYLAKYESTRARAREILEEALTIYETEYGKDAPELIDSLMLLGNSTARWGNSSRPKRYYSRALKIADKKLSPDAYATLLHKTGESLMSYSSSRDARNYLSKAHKMFNNLYGSEDRRTAMVALSLGRYYMAVKRDKQAEPYLTQALNFVETDPNYRNHHLTTLSLMVEMHENRGDRSAATPYCRAIGEISPWTNTQDYKPIFKRAPKYPSSAVSAGAQGYAVVEYTVDSSGFVTNPKVVDLEGHSSFTKASLEAAAQFRYAPAFVDGVAVDTPGVRNKFTFSLR